MIIMSSLQFVFVLCVLAVSLTNVRAVPSEDIKNIDAMLVSRIEECNAELGLTEEDIKKAMESKTLGSVEDCILACTSKKIKLMNDQGLFDFDEAEELSKKYLSDEADQKKVLNLISTCKSVNERDVSDGDKGCERTGLMIKCVTPFMHDFLN